MTTVLEREGKQWAWDVVRNVSELCINNGADELIRVLERGTMEKPADYARGVRDVIGLIRLELKKRPAQVRQ